MNEPPRKGEPQASRRTLRFLEEVIRRSSDGIVITDAARNIVVVNEAFCSYFGRCAKDMAAT